MWYGEGGFDGLAYVRTYCITALLLTQTGIVEYVRGYVISFPAGLQFLIAFGLLVRYLAHSSKDWNLLILPDLVRELVGNS